MRAYGRALTQLGRVHTEERRRLYLQGVDEGLAHGGPAQNFALRSLRERYQSEFETIFEEKLREGSAEGSA
jgi:hypothetical protein